MKAIHIHVLFGLLMVSLICVLWFVLIPDARQRFQNQASLVQDEEFHLNRNRKTIGSYMAVLNTRRANLNGMKTFVEVLSRDPFESQHAISRTLESLARKHRLALSRVNYQKANTSKSGLMGYDIDLPLKGSYRDFRQFLLDLKNREPFLAIHTISIQDMEETGSLAIELGMTCYFKEETRHE
jgi:Tfp pilus assembly protein PilO